MLFLFAFFVLAHGLAHLVYTGLALKWFPASDVNSFWTGQSWLLGFPDASLAGYAFVVATVSFAIAGIALALRQAWAPGWLALSAIASSLIILVFWDGSPSELVSKGLIGLLINIALLVLLYGFRFPAL